jgi:LAO/AO transport system kinase
MVDTFLLLTLARTGDQLQGIKKGVLELADVIAVNKADGPYEVEARRAARELAGALRLIRASDQGWDPPVLTCSGLDGAGLDTVWSHVVRHQDSLAATGQLDARRSRQQVGWVWTLVRDRLLGELRGHPDVARLAPEVERAVLDGALTPALAADRLLAAFSRRPG